MAVVLDILEVGRSYLVSTLWIFVQGIALCKGAVET
eukprot:COSAG02_NODE_48312_length_334_cov_1.323404_1_plen_35_part_10